MAKYRKKPVVIEAVQWTGENVEEVCELEKSKGVSKLGFTGGSVSIRTLEGVMVAKKDDWIIKGVKGELYPCKPDIFEQTYEKVG